MMQLIRVLAAGIQRIGFLILLLISDSLNSQVLINFSQLTIYNPDDPYALGIYDEDGTMSGPNCMRIDKSGNIYILDTNAQRILKYSAKGENLQVFSIKGQDRKGGTDFDIDDQNNLYVLNTHPGLNDYLDKIKMDGYSNTVQNVPFEIKKYDRNGKLIEKLFLIMAVDYTEYYPTRIREIYLVDDKLFLGDEYTVFSTKILNRSLRKSDKMPLIELAVEKFLPGIPVRNGIYAMKRRLKNLIIDTQENNIIVCDEKFEFDEKVYSIHNLVYIDSNGNRFIKVYNKNRLGEKLGTPDPIELWKYDKNSNLVGQFIFANEDMERLETDCIITVDDQGAVYYLQFSTNGGILRKYE